MKKVLILIMFIFIAIGSVAMRNNNQSVNNEGITESSGKTVDKEIRKEVAMEEEASSRIIRENALEYAYSEGLQAVYDYFDERTSYRFGGRVRENFIEREVELKEEDFENLRKGQYLNQKMADEGRSKYVGIVEMLGMYDGDMVYVMPTENQKEPPLGNPYYRIGENTYAVLLFKSNAAGYSPLETVEIWKEIWHEDGTYDLERRELKIK